MSHGIPRGASRSPCRTSPPAVPGLPSGSLPLLPGRPWGGRAARPVIPVFLPFMGCPRRCVFCAQDAQTGCRPEDLATRLAWARALLRRRAEEGREPAELAFYGGTFTLLPEPALSACLELACAARERGWIRAFRCSTRPDSVGMPMLERLRRAGCETVELGVQSFGDGPLAAAGRGYGGSVALAACQTVRAAGLRLGVQLLPGMPGQGQGRFLEDVALALGAGAAMLRFYPCLVLAGTALAALWRAGRYVPWTLEATMDTLARGWLACARAGRPVIRMGLAPEPSLRSAVLAGPSHPALGSRVMGRALLQAAQEALDGLAARCRFDLFLPLRAQGCLWGWKGELRPSWNALGLRRVLWRGTEEARLCPVSEP